MSKVAAMIPVLLGSTRIPDKNIILVNGKVLCSYTIHACKESGVFDTICLNSEDGIFKAIAEEEGAVKFYTELSKKVENEWMRDIFLEFAEEEKKHKKNLMTIKEGNRLLPAQQKIQDLKIGDYLVDITPTPEITYQEALILAMKKEKAAFRLYTDLAASTDTPELQSLFVSLAQEEAKHKLRFEIEYDEYVYNED